MATLAESFMADLADLSDDSASDDEVPQEQQLDGNDLLMPDAEAAAKRSGVAASVEDAAHLTSSKRYNSVMAQVREALAGGDEDGGEPAAWTGSSEDDPTYKLLVDCNQLAVDIDNELVTVHNWVRDAYRARFPELESLVQHPVDYARVVAAIGNQGDITDVDLDGVLPSATIMVVSVTASTTAGLPLPHTHLHKVLAGCAMTLQLDGDRADILKLVQTKMGRIAPNLSAVVGTAIAAQLMGVAGGLQALSQMPACNIQVLGAKKKNAAGFGSISSQPHQGFIYNCDLIQGVPPAMRPQAARIVGSKVALQARVDAAAGDPSGTQGAQMKDSIREKLEKLQEPPPAKQPKVLAAPDMEGKKRRGGKRFRKMRERYGMTDTRKAANRVNFNQAEEEFLDGDEMVGLGTLGRNAAGGRLRVAVKTQKQKLSAKTQKRAKAYGAHGLGSGAVSGLSSSLAFTPVQGIELENPNAKRDADADLKSGTESYFSEYSGFRSIKNS
mmetsp:Transcript_6589/g.19004  ORF Transcript_6589/g.19004 Transcript_6589/m.19004 type:complete len:499 (-) Transcript_6589:370-1866(-)|eukprot:CAMPEP_0206143596 /NCGR_PEP_ID=MMETSP1473-20131121/21117_1 /ASSEMBLY_ACC=CAM_ASM_001109 /TAXON_ID=1461547 /ORGANISM="Stichococcus sp, Strain RCC1054" /LENGTH=498 /DNA_ID=CAMNT_0053539073 /DNA_START=481 /DNA_END=1977 /DNA_ORIENTATION=-